MRITGYGLLLLLYLGLLSGCSGIKYYPNRPDKNFIVKTETDSGTFSDVKVALDIYDVDTDCKATYLGTVKLNRAQTAIGIRAGSATYLSFRFISTGFLGSSNSTVSYDTLVKPRAQYVYDTQVRYKGDIYSVKILEKRTANGRGRELPVHHLEQCKQL